MFSDSTNDEIEVLFIAPSNGQEALYATAIVEEVARLYPRAKITVVANYFVSSLFVLAPALNKLVLCEKNLNLEAFLKVFFHKWDVLIDCNNLFISKLLFAKKKFLIKAEANLLQEYAIALGISEGRLNPMVRIANENVRGAEKRFFKKGNVLGIAPFDDNGNFIIDAEKIVELLKVLTYPGGIFPSAPIAFFGFEGNKKAADELVSKIPEWQGLNFVGSLSLLNMEACLERCRFFIGGDSIITNMAVVANIATLAILPEEVRVRPSGRYVSLLFDNNAEVNMLEEAVKNLWYGELKQK